MRRGWCPVPRYEAALRARTEPYIWPDFLGLDTDSSETLKTLSIPGLWLFSDNDGSIPVDLSIERMPSGTTTWTALSRPRSIG